MSLVRPALGLAFSVLLGVNAVSAVAADKTTAPSALTAGWQVEGAVGFGTSTDLVGDATGMIQDTGYATWHGALRGGLPVGGAFSLQGDLQGSGDLLDSSAWGQYQTGILGGLHLSWRDPSRGLLGAFGGIGSEAPIGDGAASLWFLGAEGQLYLNNTTLYLQAGLLDSHDSADTDAFHAAAFVRGVARYFVSSSTAISGEVLLAAGKQDSDDQTMSVVTWGATLEHALASHPIVLTAGYEGGHYDNGCCTADTGKFTDHRFLLGAKFMFGEGDLLSNDRFGQTLDLPDFGRIVASGNSVD